VTLFPGHINICLYHKLKLLCLELIYARPYLLSVDLCVFVTSFVHILPVATHVRDRYLNFAACEFILLAVCLAICHSETRFQISVLMKINIREFALTVINTCICTCVSVKWVAVTMAWSVLRLRMEETTSRYGG